MLSPLYLESKIIVICKSQKSEMLDSGEKNLRIESKQHPNGSATGTQLNLPDANRNTCPNGTAINSGKLIAKNICIYTEFLHGVFRHAKILKIILASAT